MMEAIHHSYTNEQSPYDSLPWTVCHQ